MKRVFVSTLCALIAMVISLTTANAADEVKITPIKVADHIYMLTGKGGNLGLLIGDDGLFLIDDQFAPLTAKIIEAVTSVGGEHPKFLINTHYHGDHTGGNENLGKGDTLIFSHDNVRKRLKTGSFLETFQMRAEAMSAEGLPVVTFSEDITFHLNGDTVRAIHVPHAHTDGDSFVYFTGANVIHAGDIFFNGIYPFIDSAHGGTLRGMVAAADMILSMADENTKIIPGHGPLADKAAMMKFRDMLSTAYERLLKLKNEGKSLDDAITAAPLADLDETWSKGMFTTEQWIKVVYPGVY